MKILLIGGGGREHALAWKLAASPRTSRLYATPGSAAIAKWAACVPLDGHSAITEFAGTQGIDLAVVGPEAPLVAGLADALRERGIPTFGPSRAAAQLEGSKVFSKAFMQRHAIPTAAHASFSDLAPAESYVLGKAGRFVVKADGLAAGKGVIVCESAAVGLAALRQIMQQRAFGDSGARVVVEDFLEGEEASFFAVTDGREFVVLPSCQDHKPIGELDRGPNTGGMGAYCPAPVVTAEVEQRVIERIVRPTLAGMAAEGHSYQGVLYVGLMIHHGQPSVVEYNCRFGDPECQPLIMLLKSDLVDLLAAAAGGGLKDCTVSWHAGAAACVVLASPGYPGTPITGQPIEGLDGLAETDLARVFHAGTQRQDRHWINSGGRVLGVTARGDSLQQALTRSYRMVEQIHWPQAQYRRDIGLKGLLREEREQHAAPIAIVARSPGAAADLSRAAGLVSDFGLRSVSWTDAGDRAELERRLSQATADGVRVFLAIGPSSLTADVTAAVRGPVVSWTMETASRPQPAPAAGLARGSLEDAVLRALLMLALK